MIFKFLANLDSYSHVTVFWPPPRPSSRSNHFQNKTELVIIPSLHMPSQDILFFLSTISIFSNLHLSNTSSLFILSLSDMPHMRHNILLSQLCITLNGLWVRALVSARYNSTDRMRAWLKIFLLLVGTFLLQSKVDTSHYFIHA